MKSKAAVDQGMAEPIRAASVHSTMARPTTETSFSQWIDASDTSLCRGAFATAVALLLDERSIAFRCSYVDYDGDQALAEWRRRPP